MFPGKMRVETNTFNWCIIWSGVAASVADKEPALDLGLGESHSQTMRQVCLKNKTKLGIVFSHKGERIEIPLMPLPHHLLQRVFVSYRHVLNGPASYPLITSACAATITCTQSAVPTIGPPDNS